MPVGAKERVKIETPVRTDGDIAERELPHKMIVMSPLSGQRRPKLKRPTLVGLNSANNVDALMKTMKPVIRIDVTNTLTSAGAEADPGAEVDEQKIQALTLSFSSMEDFTPEGLERALSEAMPEFKKKVEALRNFENFQTQLGLKEELTGIEQDLEDPELLNALRGNIGS